MLSLALLCAVAIAEEPTFVGTEKPPEAVTEVAEVDLSAELGGTFATGNAMYYVLNGALKGSYKKELNKIGLIAGVAMGSAVADADGSGSISEEERAAGFALNARRFAADVRYDRFFGEHNSLYVLAGAYQDPFAGYDLRSHEQVGYSRLLVNNDKTSLTTELGADFAQENYVDGVDPDHANVLAARVLVGFTHKFNETTALTDTAETYVNVLDPSDTRVLNAAALSTALSSKFSLKLSHTLTFDHQPVEGFQPLDQSTMVTLVASIL